MFKAGECCRSAQDLRVCQVVITNVLSLCEQVAAESGWRFMYVPQEIQAKTSIDYLLLLNKLVLITAFVLKKILFW